MAAAAEAAVLDLEDSFRSCTSEDCNLLLGYKCGATTALALRHVQSFSTPWTLIHTIGPSRSPFVYDDRLFAEQLSTFVQRPLMADMIELLGDLPDVLKSLDAQRVNYRKRVLFLIDNSAAGLEFPTKDVPAFSARFAGLQMHYTIYWIHNASNVCCTEDLEIETDHVRIKYCLFDEVPKDLRKRSMVLPAYSKFHWKDNKRPESLLYTDLSNVSHSTSSKPKPVKLLGRDDDLDMPEHCYHDQYRVLVWSDAELDRIEYFDNWLTRTTSLKPFVIKAIDIEDPVVVRHRTAAVAVCSEIIRLQNHTSAIDDIGSVVEALDRIDDIATRRGATRVLEALTLIRECLQEDKTSGEVSLENLRGYWTRMNSSISDPDYEAASLSLIWSALNSWVITHSEARLATEMGRAFTVGSPRRWHH
jgi:hypothetical protein